MNMELELQSLNSSNEETFATESDVTIWETNDYSKFKFSELNRNPTHFKKVLESIKNNNLTKYQPILVDKYMNIVDGQNRFLACKELGLPIYFTISSEINIFAAADINQASKNWNIEDFVQHYAKRGREEYIRILDLCAKYEQKIYTISQFGKLIDGFKSSSDIIRSGNFNFRNDIDIDDFFQHHSQFKQYYNFYNRNLFIKALLKVYTQKEYDKNVMTTKLRIASGIVNEQPKVSLMVDEILKLYNYKSRKPLTIKK